MTTWQEIEKRVLAEAEYTIKNKSTVRMTAKRFKVSKSTVQEDLRVRLRQIDKTMYKNVRKVVDYNISQRAIRGGNATKRKYKK